MRKVVMKLPGKMVVWPAYLDSRKPRSKGRKISKGAAVEAPRLEEVAEAARRLGLNPEIVHEASLPHTWWVKTGYITVDKAGRRRISLLKDLAAQISSMRKESSMKVKKLGERPRV